MGSQESAAFLRPIKVGAYVASHRIVLPPLTRCRALGSIPTSAMAVYYAQRATPGGFMISEGTVVSPDGYGWPNTPGIHTQEHVDAWRPITAAVHKKGGIFFCQIWHVGRASHTVYQPDGGAPVSPTNKRLLPPSCALVIDAQGNLSKEEYSPPRAVGTDEIPTLVGYYRAAARNAVAAGFDGVEIHGASGFLIDQFLKDGINDRTDEYGGSTENRCRFCVEVAAAVADEIGAGRTGVRLSPSQNYNASDADADPVGLTSHLLEKLAHLGLAYVHLVEPGASDVAATGESGRALEALTRARKCPVIVTGGFTRETGVRAIESGYADMVGYGRHFVANPDLVGRLIAGASLAEPDYITFYTPDQTVGYTDYRTLE